MNEGSNLVLVLPNGLDPAYSLVKISAENGIVSDTLEYNSGEFSGTDTISYTLVNVNTLEELNFTTSLNVLGVEDEGFVTIEGGLLGEDITVILTDYDGIDGKIISVQLFKGEDSLGESGLRIMEGSGNSATVVFSAEFIQIEFSTGDNFRVEVSYQDDFGTNYSAGNSPVRTANLNIYELGLELTGDVIELGGEGGVKTSTIKLAFTDTTSSDSITLIEQEESISTSFGSFIITQALNDANEEIENTVNLVYTIGGEAFQLLDAGELGTDTITITSSEGLTELVTFTIIGENDDASFTSSINLTVTNTEAVDNQLIVTESYTISDADGVEQENLQVNFGIVATSGELITGEGENTVTQTILIEELENYGTLNIVNEEKQMSFLNGVKVDKLSINERVILTFSVESLDGTQLPVTVTINGENDNSVIVNDIASITEDTVITISVLENDRNAEGDILTVTAVEGAENGTATIFENDVIYTPNANFNGTESLTYTVSDERGVIASAEVVVTVTAVDDLGSLVLAGRGIAGSQVTATLTDIDGLDGQLIEFELLNNGNSLSTPVIATITGEETTTAEAIFTINAVDFSIGEIITVRASYTDEDGTSYALEGENSAVISNPVDTINTAPIAVDDVFSIAEDSGEATMSVLANDSDMNNDNLVIIAIAGAENGTARFEDKNVFYTPNTNFNGTETLTYTISDGNGATTSAEVVVTVTAVDDVGTIVLTGTGTAGSQVTATLTDIDGLDGQSIEFELLNNGNSLSTPVTATIVATGNTAQAIFTINVADFSIGEIITVRASYSDEDGTSYAVGGGTSAVISNVLDSSNTAPVAVDDVFSIAEDSGEATMTVLANDTDVDNDNLIITAVEGAENGTVRFEDKNVFYNPNANFNGTETLTYTISDGNGATSSAEVVITVIAVDDLGSLVLAGRGIAGSQVTATLTDIDGLDGQLIEFELLNNGNSLSTPVIATITGEETTTAEAIFTINAADFSIGEIITVRASYTDEDGTSYAVGGETSAIISNPVDSINTAPVAVDDVFSIAEDSGEATMSVLANDTDVDNDNLVIIAIAGAENGTARFEDKNLFYNPNANFNGTETLTYTISDGNGATT